MVKAKKSTKGRSIKASGAKKEAKAPPVDLSSAKTPGAMRAALAKLGKTALQAKYKEVFGQDAKSDNVHHLRVALSKKLLPKPTKEQAADEKKLARPPKERDARLPVAGAVIERPYKGVKHKVKVLADEFEYGGKRHGSLSAIAKSITGQQTNGFLWFGLIKRPTKPAASSDVGAAKRAPAKAKKSGAKKGATKKSGAKKAKG